MDLLKFESLAQAGKKYSKNGVPGMALTVYASKASLSEELWQALGCPERVDLVKEESRGMLIVDSVKDGGFPIQIKDEKRNRAKIFGDSSIKNEINKIRPYDWRGHFLRFTGGKAFRGCWCFSLDEDVTEVECGTRTEA